MARRWLFGAALCRVYYALTCVNMFTGTFTVTLMGVDRFVAVWWPVLCNRSAALQLSPRPYLFIYLTFANIHSKNIVRTG